MRGTWLSAIGWVAAFSWINPAVQADVTLPAIFGSNMVLQQGSGTALWGKADRGEKVTVQIGAVSASATADDRGRWRVALPALKAESKPVEVAVQGHNRVELKNVLIGDVWLGAGQSNMEFSVVRAKDGEAEVAAAHHPTLRLFHVKKTAALEPAEDVSGEWQECSPDTVKGFSAVLYYFGRDLQERIHVPVGLIEAAWSGTRIQAWSPPVVLLADSYCKEEMAKEAQRLDDPKWVQEENDRRMAKWTAEAQKAKAEGKPEPRKPLLMARNDANRCCVLYNGMIAPLTDFQMRGVAWYQAENNSGSPGLYARLFEPMIASWRAAWHQPELPFVFVQLPNWLSHGRQADPVDTLWTRMREAQATALALPHTGMAVTIDVGNPDDIHPLDKQTVGRRLMLAALAAAYGDADTTSPGPEFAGMTREGSQIEIRFRNAGKGLVLSDSRPLNGFLVAGADHVFHPVTGSIAGDKVILNCDGAADVQAVRYAWSDDPQPNLYNQEGLPAVPFRTDQWPQPSAVAK